MNFVEALRGADYQVIVSMGETTNEFTNLPENIQVYDSVDQMAVLNIADAFVTHCGMNSASEGLYFKVPLVLSPQTPEQWAVAKRTEELGAGVMVPVSGRSVVEIKNAIEKVLNDGAYKAAATEISKGFKRCGGVKEARSFLGENREIEPNFGLSINPLTIVVIVKKYRAENNNPAIISKVTLQAAQIEKQHRSNVTEGEEGSQRKSKKYSSKK